MSRVLIGLAALWFFAGGFAPVKTSACGNDLLPQHGCKPCKRPDGTMNHAPNVTELILDRNELHIKPIHPGQPPEDADRSPDMLVNVATNAEDAENDVLTYTYTVSAGRIIGSGSAVTWNLSGAAPGVYTITAAVDDSCGICGKIITKTVKVIGLTIPVSVPATVPATVPAVSYSAAPTAPSPAKVAAQTAPLAPAPAKFAASIAAASTPVAGKVCACPKISIADPEKSDSDLIFTAKIDGPVADRLSFIWTVIGAKIVSQDKESIRVKPGSLAIGGSINVIVNGLEPRCNCPNQARKTF